MLENLRQSLDFRLNSLYFILQGFYWMIVCAVVSLGSAYLSTRGYSTISIGILFACSYVFAALIQQIISINTDNSSKYDVIDVLGVLGIIILVDLVFAIGTSEKGFATGLTFFISVLFITMVQPFLNALNFYIVRHGIYMNYGVSRSSGSLFFFLMSLTAGNFMKIFSERVLPILGLIMTIGFLATLFMIKVELKKSGRLVSKDYDPFEKKNSDDFSVASIKAFVQEYRMFFVVLIGVTCFFFGHLLLNNFIYQITINVGGDSADTGGMLALAAILELPAMICFSKLRDIFGTKILFGASAVFFFIKIFVTSIASSVGGLYFSMLFQAASFALFIPASVHLVDELMTTRDAVKGQAFMTVAMTICNALTGLFGGVLIFLFGVTASLWFSTLVTFCGVVVTIYGLFRINLKN